MSQLALHGIHHLTAVSASIRENLRFYTSVLGLRLVKRSVNQDDVSAYHLFYADAVGTPGTDITFFDWEMPRERRGTGSIVRTGFRVREPEALDWWAKRLQAFGVTISPIAERDGRATLDFEDFEGQRLCLVDDQGTGQPSQPWDRSPVPPEYQLRGLGPITLSVRGSSRRRRSSPESWGCTRCGSTPIPTMPAIWSWCSGWKETAPTPSSTWRSRPTWPGPGWAPAESITWPSYTRPAGIRAVGRAAQPAGDA